MRNFENINRIVIKVGTSTLTYENGSLNLRRIEQLARVISDLQNSGKHIVLVSSGAIGVGAQKNGLGSSADNSQGKTGSCCNWSSPTDGNLR
ncbi:amino acid kinase family protein [Lactococcus fujiensis]|uniref:amino acid kinase family protein n=1 Tax=Lactococcus fujiensis TaxID=610251 RepID=UPI000A6161DB